MEPEPQQVSPPSLPRQLSQELSPLSTQEVSPQSQQASTQQQLVPHPQQQVTRVQQLELL